MVCDSYVRAGQKKAPDLQEGFALLPASGIRAGLVSLVLRGFCLCKAF
jgi:hypothetical protein